MSNKITPFEGILLSGKDAWIAKANKQDVEWKLNGLDWAELTDTEFLSWSTERFLSPDSQYLFRLKPQITRINDREMPLPFIPRNGEIFYYLDARNSKGYSSATYGSDYSYKFYIQLGAWRTEEEVKQAYAAIKAAIHSE